VETQKHSQFYLILRDTLPGTVWQCSGHYILFRKYDNCEVFNLPDFRLTRTSIYILTLRSCNKFNLFKEILLVATQVVVGILLALRMYALYECSRRILASILVIAFVLVTVASWSLFGQTNVDEPMAAGCHTGVNLKTSIRIAGAYESLLIYDGIIFGLTVFKTWTTRYDYTITGIRTPLIRLLLRDGAIYFGVIVFVNLLNILTFYFAGPFMRGGLSMVANCISLTMICRLMLNLHRFGDTGIYTTSWTLSEFNFASIQEIHAPIN